MVGLTEWAEKCLRRRSRGISLSNGSYERTSLLNIDEPFEEETLSTYKPNNYYPVQVGQALNARYRVLGKLGYDASGTTWFCHDNKVKRYVEVKVSIALPANGSNKCRSNSEWNAYSHMSGMVTENTGVSYLRQILDRFTVVSTIGAEHQCFVYVPVGLDLAEFQRLAPNADLKLLKDILRVMLQALDFLHQDARIIHTEFKPETILFTVTHKGTLDLFAKKLQSRQPVGKRDNASNRIIYQTVRFTKLLQLHEISLGKPVLADLGGARIMHKDDTQLLPRDKFADAFTAPEILLGMCWSFATDIWSCAVVTWLLFARSPLFTATDSAGIWDASEHMRQITKVLGPAPSDFPRAGLLQTSPSDKNTVESEIDHVEGLVALNIDDKVFAEWDLDQRTEFVDFMHAMLKWRAEERCSASELLDHAFLDENSAYE